MLVRFQAGRLRQMKRVGAAKRRQAARRVAIVRLPRRFGWLVQAGGSEAVCFGSQLQMMLNTPEMCEMLAASAQARRILRPLCRALALEVPMVSATPAVADSGDTRRRKVRPRIKPEPFRIPFPRGVLSAARRQGFGKLC
jgi:hypothetical protein